MYGVGAKVLMWRSEKSFMELVLSLPFVGSVGRIKVIELGVTTPPQFLFIICRMWGGVCTHRPEPQGHEVSPISILVPLDSVSVEPAAFCFTLRLVASKLQ